MMDFVAKEPPCLALGLVEVPADMAEDGDDQEPAIKEWVLNGPITFVWSDC
jgi:hypothetical protein